MKDLDFEKVNAPLLVRLRGEVCAEVGDCDECPAFISKHCKEVFKTMEPRKTESKAPNDTPKGWIKLKIPKKTIYFNVSKIVCILATDPTTVPDGAATTVYTVGTEVDDNPWLVCDRIDEVMEKIKKASQEK